MPSAPTGDKGISKQESQESTRSWSAWWRGRKTTRETTSVTEPSEIKTTTDAKEEKIVEEVIQETSTLLLIKCFLFYLFNNYSHRQPHSYNSKQTKGNTYTHREGRRGYKCEGVTKQ